MGLKFHTSFPKASNSIRTINNSKFLSFLLTKRFGFPLGVKCHAVKIPEEIINSETTFVFATIRGIFDTDGCVFIDKRNAYKNPYPRITFVTVSKQLYLQLKAFLENYFSLYCAKKMPAESEYNRSPRYEITIYGKKQLEKWVQLIGFSNERHLSKIKTLKPMEGIEPSTC